MTTLNGDNGFLPWDEEDEQRTKAELDETIRIEEDSKKAWEAEAQAEQQQQEAQAADPAAQQSQPTQQPTQETQQPQQQKQVPGWGADPKPEDRWNIRDRAPARSEVEGLTDPLTAAEAVSAPIVGTIDGMASIYNTFTPGPDIPKIPQFQDKNLQVIRDVSEFVGPNFLGVGLIGKGAKALQGVSAVPNAVHKLGTNPIFKLFAVTGLDMGVGGVVDTSIHKDGDDNFQRQLRDMLKTPEGENLFGIFPSSWATDNKSGNVGPDQNRARVRNEGMGLGLFMGIGEGLLRIGKAIADTNAATKWISKDDTAKQYFENIQTDEFSKTKYSDDHIEDAMLRSEARTSRSLDELGEFYVAKRNEANIAEGKPFQTADELEFEGPVKGIHDSFDQLEQGVINPSPGGVPEVMVDAARIKGNIQTTNGRLGSMTTEGALKYGLEVDSLEKGLLVKQIQDRIKASGKFDYLLNDQLISAKKIDDAGTWLAEEMINMNPGEMNELLDGFRKLNDDLNLKVVNNVGYDAIMKSMRGYMDMFLDLDAIKARAFLTTSYAGQASDLAGEWAKVGDSAAVESARNMIMDRIEFLMVHKALSSYDAGATLAGKNVWERIANLGKKEDAADYVLKETQAREKYLGTLVPNVKGFTKNLMQIMEEKPNFMKPLFDAYHLTDGKVSTMYDLNRYVYENLGEVTQAFARGEDTMPNLIVSGMYNNYYNSILSATATPFRAAVGNLGGIITRPVTTMAGALMEGDLETISRAAYQYAGVKDAFTNAWSHMSFFMKKTLENPMSTMEYGRSDLTIVRNEKNIEVLRTTATAMAEDGHHGPEYLLNMYEDMHSIATNPWFRYSANMMGAADAFTRAFVATAEARGRAYDKVLKPGKKIKPSELKKVNEETYKSLHNSKGWISDEAIGHYSKEIALNLDSPLATNISTLIQNQPWLKPIMLFPRTSVNILNMFAKYSPLARFNSDAWDVLKYGNNPPLQHVQEVLSKKGISFDENALNTYHQMRREAKGRIAVGTMAAASVSMMFSEDRIRGTGHWDKERQRVRTANDWAPKTVLIGGKWVSYEFLGPMGDWISLMADIHDNFDLISSASTEKLGDKMRYILGAAITDRSLMAQVEPLTAMNNGNGSEFQRFIANAANGAVPFGGLRNQFSRLMTDGMKEVDNDLTQLLRNKNNWLDGINPDGGLGAKYSWVDDQTVGHVESWGQRAANAFLGWRVSDKLSENRQFLLDIEYDTTPAMSKSKEGVPYPSHIRSAIFESMAKDGTFRRLLTNIRNQKGETYLKRMKDIRRRGYRSTDVESNDLMNLHAEIDAALRQAQTIAEGQLDAKHKQAIQMIEANQRIKQSAARDGTITPEKIDQINSIYK